MAGDAGLHALDTGVVGLSEGMNALQLLSANFGCYRPERRCAGAQFLNPMILVKKGGKLPGGHIQSWFWERGSLRDSLPLKLPPRARPRARFKMSLLVLDARRPPHAGPSDATARPGAQRSRRG